MAVQPQQSLTNLIQRLGQLPPSRMLGLVVALAAIIALVVGLVMWSRTPDYRVLFSNLSEKDGGAVIAALQQMNIPYQTEGGGAILVPSDQVYDLRFRLASQGLPKGGAVGFELMDSSKLGMTQFQEQVAFQRGMEGELARTIQSLAPVESARVHLAIPKPSVFVRDQQQPSASVLVNLYPGRSLDPAQVSSIVHLVSSGVPSLNANNVTVVDQAGNLLTSKSDATTAQGLNASQLDYRKQVEDYYARRIESIVAPIVGTGNVRAEVRADLDFAQAEMTSESYKPNPAPDAQAVRSQQTVEDSSGAGPAQAAGVPGAFSNQPPGAATAPMTAPPGANAGPTANAAGQAAGGQGGSSRRENTVNYELDKTIRHVREAVGNVKRLSVAVVVNYRSVAGDDGQAQAKPLTPEELGQVNNLVREAMGFSQERGDTVNVVNAAFSEEKVEPADIPLWKDPDNVSMGKSLLKNLLIFGLAFYLVFGVLRPLLRDLMKPLPPRAGREPAYEEEAMEAATPAMRQAQSSYDQVLHNTQEIAKANPKLTAEVVKEWMTKE